jgi:hypothetical protein
MEMVADQYGPGLTTIARQVPFCAASRLVYAEATVGFSAIASLSAIATIWTSESASFRHGESASFRHGESATIWTSESTSFRHGESATIWTSESTSLRHGESAIIWTGEFAGFRHGESATIWTGESASLRFASLCYVRNITSVALYPRRATSTRRTAIAHGSA